MIHFTITEAAGESKIAPIVKMRAVFPWFPDRYDVSIQPVSYPSVARMWEVGVYLNDFLFGRKRIETLVTAGAGDTVMLDVKCSGVEMKFDVTVMGKRGNHPEAKKTVQLKYRPLSWTVTENRAPQPGIKVTV